MQNKRNINSFGITLNRYCMLQHVLGEGGGLLYATSGTLGEEAGGGNYMLQQVLWGGGG